jgi:hypothetical protein
LLNHAGLNPTGNIKLDILNYLFIIYEVSIFDLKVMTVMHEHALAPDIAILFRAPSKLDHDWAIKKVILLYHNPLV